MIPKQAQLKRNKRNALPIQIQRHIQRKMFQLQLRLVEPGCSGELLQDYVRYFEPKQYDELVEERYVQKLCGWPCCSQQISDRQGKYRISLAQHEIFQATNSRKYCSEICLKLSMAFRLSLSPEPLFTRPIMDNLIQEAEQLQKARKAQALASGKAVGQREICRPQRSVYVADQESSQKIILDILSEMLDQLTLSTPAKLSEEVQKNEAKVMQKVNIQQSEGQPNCENSTLQNQENSQTIILDILSEILDQLTLSTPTKLSGEIRKNEVKVIQEMNIQQSKERPYCENTTQSQAKGSKFNRNASPSDMLKHYINKEKKKGGLPKDSHQQHYPDIESLNQTNRSRKVRFLDDKENSEPPAKPIRARRKDRPSDPKIKLSEPKLIQQRQQEAQIQKRIKPKGPVPIVSDQVVERIVPSIVADLEFSIQAPDNDYISKYQYSALKASERARQKDENDRVTGPVAQSHDEQMLEEKQSLPVVGSAIWGSDDEPGEDDLLIWKEIFENPSDDGTALQDYSASNPPESMEDEGEDLPSLLNLWNALDEWITPTTLDVLSRIRQSGQLQSSSSNNLVRGTNAQEDGTPCLGSLNASELARQNHCHQMLTSQMLPVLMMLKIPAQKSNELKDATDALLQTFSYSSPTPNLKSSEWRALGLIILSVVHNLDFQLICAQMKKSSTIESLPWDAIRLLQSHLMSLI